MAIRRVTVEAMVLRVVRDAAAARAESQARQLPAVAKAILVNASRRAKPTKDGVAHPAQRPSEAERARVRFRMEAAEHATVKERIRLSGKSMTAVLEEGLENYARTGVLDDVR